MSRYDFHMHTNFSSDSNATMESMVRAGIQKGVTEVCFTDHVEFDPAPPYDEEVFDPFIYQAEIERLRKIYGDQIEIRMGVEMGYQPHIVHRMNQFVSRVDFDFILCSLHSIDKLDFHTKAFFEGKTSEAAFENYFEVYYECAKSDITFSVLSHFDFLKRYAPYNGDQLFKDNFDLIEGTFKQLIEKGKGIEVNTSGFTRYKLGHSLPSADFLRRYKELGGEIITTGSDAHSPRHVAEHFDVTCELLKSVGFRYITRFEKMKPAFIKL